MYYVLNLASYYLYSGDLDFVRSQYAIVQRQLAYNRALVDPTTGLLISNSSERDWDFYDGGKPGAVTAYNAIYYKALTDAAYDGERARQHGRRGRRTSAQAADLKQRINATLFDATRGVYKLADRDNANHAGQLGAAGRQLGGDHVRHRARERARRHPELAAHATCGSRSARSRTRAAANYSTVISPFVSGKEVDARFAAGDTQGALDLIHLLWDQMTNESGPYYTATMWEKLNRDGTDVDANASLSHGWATAPTPSAEPLRARRAAGDRGLQDVARRAADRATSSGRRARSRRRRAASSRAGCAVTATARSRSPCRRPRGRRARCACRCSAARGRSRWTARWSGRTAPRRRA